MKNQVVITDLRSIKAYGDYRERKAVEEIVENFIRPFDSRRADLILHDQGCSKRKTVRKKNQYAKEINIHVRQAEKEDFSNIHQFLVRKR
jgi:hypothetical protein